ncbi:ABC transporter permease [Algoriphagus sediminis]|uniref:ABC transporter permease n=1 Tax=Algoriphagus sediminis TaxID=3057113 RepID=A0ABT7Y9X7_9BACT|nr:ABC transporter permease [Algoriphagus sediminis]MDN3203322.1 ABC transporter permease [Algoriphagus sediminis]
MLKNYIKIAYRNLLKNKVYSLINIFGLGVGIACCFLIFNFVQKELSYDTYHANYDRIYRVIHGNTEGDNTIEGKSYDDFWVWGNAPVGPALQNDFPEVDKVVRFSGRADILFMLEEVPYQETGVLFMDSTAFDVFSWKLIHGDPKTVLDAPYKVVLTESTAMKYFGETDVVGRTLDGSASPGRSDAGLYTVSGVMEDVPENSHFDFNLLLSFETFSTNRPFILESWGYVDTYTYLLMDKNTDFEAFQAKLPSFVERVRALDDDIGNYDIAVEKMEDFYLRSEAQRQPGTVGSLPNIYIFSMIGLFILVIAIINFMNLSTARSLERAKEVGIRKSIGADRSSLIYQFLGESGMIVSLAGIVAVLLVALALPIMNDLTGKTFIFNEMLNTKTIPLFIIGLMIVGLLAGSYPALALSSFKPVSILKGVSKTDSKGVALRKGLVVFQFALSISLIVGTLVVYNQMTHLLDRDMGFTDEQMLLIEYNYDFQVNSIMEPIRDRLEDVSGVKNVAFSRSVPGSYFPNAGTGIVNAEGEFVYKDQAIFQVGMDFIEQYDLEMVAGRSYSRDILSDTTQAIVVNEALARQYGYANPADMLGKRFEQWGKEGEVIGIVKDFNFVSLHNEIEPLSLPYEPFASRYVSIKVETENLQETITEVEDIWSEMVPHRPFLYSFLDEDFNNQYEADFRFRKIFTSFSVLAILIACLGLLGLATYTAEQRTKEIGIRKVLGANVASLIAMLSWDFVKLVLIALALAIPVSWWAMDSWLQGFAYRTNISIWIFPLAGILALSVAVFTISFQSLKAALVNPVKSLKSE